jgi:hypothetical protein
MVDLDAIETRWDCQQHHWDKGLTREGLELMDKDFPALFNEVCDLRQQVVAMTQLLTGEVIRANNLALEAATLRARVARMEAMMRTRQWTNAVDGGTMCPSCWNRRTEGHTATCEWVAAMGDA